MTVLADPSRVQHATPRKRTSAAPRLLAELRRRAASTVDGTVLVSNEELATALDVSVRTICRASSDLAVTGLIVKTGADIRYTPNTYQVLV